MARFAPFLLVLVLVAMSTTVKGFLFRRSSSSTINQNTHYQSTNNCHCNNQQYIGEVTSLAAILAKLLGGGKLGKREAAAVLDLEEDYPGLEEFLVQAGADSNGMVDKRDFVDAVKRITSHNSQNNSPNLCHCGRAIVDQFNFEL